MHYETELVVKITRTGKCIAERFAHRYYDEVTLGIDFTARDLQRAAIAQGHPWEIGKAFDRSAAIAPRWLGLAALGRPVGELRFGMALNGEPRQEGYTGDMLFSVDRIIAYVSQFVTLRMGDLRHPELLESKLAADRMAGGGAVVGFRYQITGRTPIVPYRSADGRAGLVRRIKTIGSV